MAQNDAAAKNAGSPSIGKVKGFYRSQLERFGTDDIKGMGWHDEGEYLKRFDLACSVINPDGKSILDVGCGFGGLFGFLRSKGLHSKRYLGVDILPEMVMAARQKNPDAEFSVMDILHDDPGRFDYAVAIGTLNITGEDYSAYVRRFIRRLTEIATEGAVVILLDDADSLARGPYHVERAGLLKREIEKLPGYSVTLHRTKELSGECLLFIERTGNSAAKEQRE